jgi:hypothetical protein
LFECNGLPRAVRALLDGHDRFRDAELVDAILERRTDLRDGVRGLSQTDLLAILGLGNDLVIVVVEGKVDEPFGPLISEWLTGEPHKQIRLSALAKTLGATGDEISTLRYQLFHRTASAVYEAQRYRSTTALMLVHSFSRKRSGWDEFAAFVRAIGLCENPRPGEILGPKRVEAVALYAAWLTDDLSSTAA